MSVSVSSLVATRFLHDADDVGGRVDLESMRRHGLGQRRHRRRGLLRVALGTPLRAVAEQRAARKQAPAKRHDDQRPQRGMSFHVQSMTPHRTIQAVGILLQQGRLVRKLVTIARPARETAALTIRPPPSTPASAPSANRPARKWLFHEPADRFPVGRGNPGRRAAVGDDFHVPVGHQYIDEYAVAKFGVPDVQVRENVCSARSRGVRPAHSSGMSSAVSTTKRISPLVRVSAAAIAASMDSHARVGKRRRVPARVAHR